MSQNMRFRRLRTTLKIGWQALGGIVGPGKEVRVGVSADSPLVAVPGRLIRAQSPPRWPLLRCLLRINTPLTATLLPALLHCDKPLHSLQRASQLLDSWLQVKCTSFAKLSSSLGSCVRLFSPPPTPSLHRPGSQAKLVLRLFVRALSNRSSKWEG